MYKDGYQYINLGRTAGINTGFEMKLWCNTTHNKRYKAFFGVEDTSNKGDFRFTYQATDTIVAYVGGNGTHNVINIPNSSGDIVLSYNPTNKTVTSNGVNYVYSTVKDFQTTNTMYLFNMNRAGNNSSDAYYGKIYYTKIYESGELVMDLIPVIDFLGRPAMYDRVNSKYYYNQGGTEFTTPLEYTEVEYLEASGNQYIDTKTKRKSVYSSEVKIMMNETISNEKPIFGGRNSLADALVLFYRLSNNTLELTAGSLGVTPVTNIEKGVEYVVNITNKSLNVVGGSVNFTKDISNNISTDGISDIALFTFINSGGSVDSRKFEGRIYSYKLINGTILVQDFIPVLDSYGEACMYDRVTNTFFYNSGSGNFKTNLTDISND